MRKRMEKLLAKVEELASAQPARPSAPLSPTEMLAQQWRERLAANTISGGARAQCRERERPLARPRTGSAQLRRRSGPATDLVRYAKSLARSTSVSSVRCRQV